MNPSVSEGWWKGRREKPWKSRERERENRKTCEGEGELTVALILLPVFMALFRITIKLTVLWRVDSSHTHTHTGRLTHRATHRDSSYANMSPTIALPLDSFLWKIVSCEETAERKEGTGRNESKTN